MRFNPVWKMMAKVVGLLITMNSRLKAIDARIKALESSVGVGGGNYEDMAAEIKAVQDAINGRIE
ncbi:hypothetical protein D3C71_1585990 [compost metagenome]